MSSDGVSAVSDVVPWQDTVTSYDEQHFALYLQLLDGHANGTSDEELCRTILKLEPTEDGKRTLASHLARARWMTEQGYRQLLGG